MRHYTTVEFVVSACEESPQRMAWMLGNYTVQLESKGIAVNTAGEEASL